MGKFTVADRDRLLADPIAFLDNAAISVAGSVYKPDHFGKPDRLTLVPDEHTPAYKLIQIGSDFGMRAIPHYLLKKAGPRDAMYFDAYIIEYVATKTPISILGTEATLAFTANMNGCTLGIGSQATASDCLVVTHSNSQGHGSQAANTADQAKKATAVVGEGALLFEPTTYRTNDKMSITFGVRSRNEKWSFHYLSYRRANQRITSYGVQTIGTNQFSG